MPSWRSASRTSRGDDGGPTPFERDLESVEGPPDTWDGTLGWASSRARGAWAPATTSCHPKQHLPQEPEVAVYPDSGKVMARQQAPGTPATGVRAIFRFDGGVGCWDGEADQGEAR